MCSTLQQLLYNRLVRFVLALAYTVWLAIILIQPEHQPIIQTGIPPGPNTLEREIAFTILHIIAFTLLTSLWYRLFIGRFSLGTSLAIAGSIAVGVGGVTEYMQNFAPDRHATWGDFLSNVMGMLIVANFVRWRLNSALTAITADHHTGFSG